jgi:hypothetical protein
LIAVITASAAVGLLVVPRTVEEEVTFAVTARQLGGHGTVITVSAVAGLFVVPGTVEEEVTFAVSAEETANMAMILQPSAS